MASSFSSPTPPRLHLNLPKDWKFQRNGNFLSVPDLPWFPPSLVVHFKDGCMFHQRPSGVFTTRRKNGERCACREQRPTSQVFSYTWPSFLPYAPFARLG
jgi:hypothetical protein